MMTILEYLTDLVCTAFDEAGFSGVNPFVTTSNRPDLCQYQCSNAFQAAKIHRTNPVAAADAVAEILAENSIFQQIEVVKPGFINIILTDEFLLAFLMKMHSDEKKGMPVITKPETVVLDYGGPNIAKPLHIGHLRSAVIGDSIKRILRYAGYNVIGDVHLGDWGLPMGLIIAEMKERNPQWECFSENFNRSTCQMPEISVDSLNEIYPFASAKSKENPEFMAAAKEITFELQHGNPGYFALWEKIRSVSVADLKRLYGELLVDFDLWYGESDSNKYVDRLIEILEEKKLLFLDDGAMVVDVSEETDVNPMPPILIKKSDNSILYGTTDLATIVQREEDFHPEHIWYVVDSRQSLHFEQVFRCARKAELVQPDADLTFLGFGTMNGTDGKPYKTRDGGVMSLETLLNLVKSAAYKQLTASKHLDADEVQIKELADRIGIASIKFGDLINHHSKNYIFDIEKFTASEGKTGPYILYSLTRIQSILNKLNVADTEASRISAVKEPEERNLILTILYSGDAFRQAVAEKAPNIICEQLYQIAAAYTKFYQACNIAGEADLNRRENLLSLTKVTRSYLLCFMDLLGIEPVERM